MKANLALEKKSRKQAREHKVLLGLVDYYLKTGRPVGSNSLKEAGFGELSSATIRNYFSNLEAEGYLIQQHSSGGRIPTHLAYHVYAEEYLNSTQVNEEEQRVLNLIRHTETREIASFLQHSAESLSSLSKCAVFLSAPRFDHDFIIGFKIVPIDQNRCLCAIITDFGLVRTEILSIPTKMTTFTAKRIEAYCQWRLTGSEEHEALDPEEEQIAQKIYNELIVRYIVNYSSFLDAELYRTGFSQLLTYPDFKDTSVLATSLSLFENTQQLRLLIKEPCRTNSLKYWIGADLSPFIHRVPDCSIIAIPYYINQSVAGAVGLLGPTRIPYRELFGILHQFSNSISEAITRNLYKFKITFRQPHAGTHSLEKEVYQLVDQKPVILLEKKEH